MAEEENQAVNPKTEANKVPVTRARGILEFLPKSYKDWQDQKHAVSIVKQRGVQPERDKDKAFMERLKKTHSKLRSDALSQMPEGYYSAEREITLEEGLHQKLARLKQININEEPFTYSLKKVHDRSFIARLLPSIMVQ